MLPENWGAWLSGVLSVVIALSVCSSCQTYLVRSCQCCLVSLVIQSVCLFCLSVLSGLTCVWPLIYTSSVTITSHVLCVYIYTSSVAITSHVVCVYIYIHHGSISRGTSHATTTERYQYTTSVYINNMRCKRIQSLIQKHMRHVRSESARD